MTGTSLYVYLLVLMICGSQILGESNNEEEEQGSVCNNCRTGCNNITEYCDGYCENGYYGSDCNSTCPVNCYSRCEKDTGKCTFCKDTYYGPLCSNVCSIKCRHQYCNQTGHCVGCEKTHYGEQCENDCPLNCNLGCDQHTGECRYGCKEGLWGHRCQNKCRDECEPPCAPTTGYCSLCKPGYGGFNCETKCMIPHCNSCSEKDTCYKCSDGWFGEGCEKQCPLHCKNSKCNLFDGSCTCSDGWFGEKCEHTCINNCDTCVDNSTCNVCSDGFYGQYCENKCPGNCSSCSRDGEKCSRCTPDNIFGELCSCDLDQCLKRESQAKCTECKQAGWFLHIGGCCKCSDHCIGGHAKCDKFTGICTDGCQPGYYGKQCLDICSSHCAGNSSVCNSTTGECPHGCEHDWYKSTCKYGCSFLNPYCTHCSQFKDTVNKFEAAYCDKCGDGYYKPVLKTYCEPCENCLNDKCNGSTGYCINGCKQGFYLPFPHTFGHCTAKCSSNCIDGLCDTVNGTCLNGCKQGFSGETCTVPCPTRCVNQTCDQYERYCDQCIPGLYGDMCFRSCNGCIGGRCNQKTGVCEDGCTKGYYGQKCSYSCSLCLDGYCDRDGQCLYGCILAKYGKYCNQTCPGGCLVVCHPISGECLTIPPACHGSQCDNFTDKVCPTGKFGFHCEKTCNSGCVRSSLSDYTCEKYSGACIHSCHTGRYGQQCEHYCGDCLDGNTTLSFCDPKTGHCDKCLQGYYGDKCKESCRDTCLNTECYKDGACANGCKTGWKGRFCNVKHSIQEKSETGLSEGAVIGIVFGALAVVGLVVTMTYFIIRRRNGHILVNKEKKRVFS